MNTLCTMTVFIIPIFIRQLFKLQKNQESRDDMPLATGFFKTKFLTVLTESYR